MNWFEAFYLNLRKGFLRPDYTRAAYVVYGNGVSPSSCVWMVPGTHE